MPDGVEHLETWIKSLEAVEYQDLTPEEIKHDTETVDGQFYELPKTKLIRINLYSVTINGGFEWATMRRWTPQKWEYYEGLLGQQIQIVIENE